MKSKQAILCTNKEECQQVWKNRWGEDLNKFLEQPNFLFSENVYIFLDKKDWNYEKTVQSSQYTNIIPASEYLESKEKKEQMGCAHGRPVGQPCPHCLGLNNIKPQEPKLPKNWNPDDCCEKCHTVDFEKTYPAHTAHDACTKPWCECHVKKAKDKEQKCKSCRVGKNSMEDGGCKTCFHCGNPNCGYVECAEEEAQPVEDVESVVEKKKNPFYDEGFSKGYGEGYNKGAEAGAERERERIKFNPQSNEFQIKG